mgnify:CR=1 FL=1
MKQPTTNPNDLTVEDIKNILNLIARVANITGQEALAVAVTQQKLQALLPPEEKKEEVKEEPKGE